MGNGSGDSDIRNHCNLCVDRLDKTVGTGIKSDVRCGDVSDERVGGYDASFLTRFQPSNSTGKNISIRLEWSVELLQIKKESALGGFPFSNALSGIALNTKRPGVFAVTNILEVSSLIFAYYFLRVSLLPR